MSPSILHPNTIAGAIMAKKKPEGGVEVEGEESPVIDIGEESDDEGLNAAARDLMAALHAKDEAGVAQAFKSAFEILESQPHEEAGEPMEQPQNEEME